MHIYNIGDYAPINGYIVISSKPMKRKDLERNAREHRQQWKNLLIDEARRTECPQFFDGVAQHVGQNITEDDAAEIMAEIQRIFTARGMWEQTAYYRNIQERGEAAHPVNVEYGEGEGTHGTGAAR